MGDEQPGVDERPDTHPVSRQQPLGRTDRKRPTAMHVVVHRALVGGEGPRVIAIGDRQFAGKDVGAHHGQAGAATDRGPGQYPASPTRLTRPRDQLSMRSWVIESR